MNINDTYLKHKYIFKSKLGFGQNGIIIVDNITFSAQQTFFYYILESSYRLVC